MQKSVGSNDTSNSGLSATATVTPTNEKADETRENGNGAKTSEDSSARNNANNDSNQVDGLTLLKMSAKELRAKLAMRKKYDPKKETIGFKDKFDIVQKL